MFETQLFNAMQRAGRGTFKSSFTNLIYKHRSLIDITVESQLIYLLDVVTSKDFNIVHNEDKSIRLTGPNIDYTISNLDNMKNTCTLRNYNHISYPRFEYFDGLLSVIEAGEVILIIPL